VAFALGAFAPHVARALDSETFDDYKAVGAPEDARKKPAALSVDGHSIEPSLSWKLFDIVAPHVFAAETVGYSDNVYHQRDVGTHSPYSRTSVGGRADINLEDHVFSAGLRASDSYYFKADQTDYFDMTADARLDLNFTNFQVHGDGAYERIVFPAAIQLGGQFVRESAYHGQAWVESMWNRVGGKVGVSFRRDDFDNTGSSSNLKGLDHDTVGCDVQFDVKLAEKLTGLVEYDFEAIRFLSNLNRDSDSHQIRLGIQGTLSAKLAFSIKLGYTYQQVHEGTGTFQDHGHYSGFNAAAALSWQVLPQLSLSASYRRDLTWAIQNNYETVDSISLGAGYKFGPAEKLNAGASFTYSHGEPDLGGHFDQIGAGLSFGWTVFKWLDLSAFYQYTQGIGARQLKASDFDEHRVGVSVAVGF
jgi:hypothetical protein